MHAYMRTYKHMWAHMCIYAHIYAYMRTYMDVRMHIRMYACLAAFFFSPRGLRGVAEAPQRDSLLAVVDRPPINTLSPVRLHSCLRGWPGMSQGPHTEDDCLNIV